jgi:hypothetical protein
MKSNIALIVILSAAVVTGCKQSGSPAISSTEASPNDSIRSAIQEHLAHNSNLNLKSFDTQVKQVTINGTSAQAQVEFHVKNGPGAMQLTYALIKAHGAWSVVESKPEGSNFSHPALDGTQTPANDGAIGGQSAVFHALDNLHGASTPRQDLPPAHPAIVAPPKGRQSTNP